jgi:hypothetical protein
MTFDLEMFIIKSALSPLVYFYVASKMITSFKCSYKIQLKSQNNFLITILKSKHSLMQSLRNPKTIYSNDNRNTYIHLLYVK